MLRSLHLWNQQSSFGELQNQAYGYIFPQGLFFLGGQETGAPDWVVQRLWSGLVLIVAFEGARRLWRALSPDSEPWSALVAGVAFATAPRLLGLDGVLSAEILPTAVAPWCVLPLVLAQRGRLGPATGGLLAGAAVLFLGGVNGVENLAVLPLPLLVVLASLRAPGGRRLGAWWAGATALACTWWMFPLLVLGRYSPPFLDYIETSAAVTRPLGWTNAARGADHWLAFIFVGGRSWWPGAFDLATEPVLIVLTAVAAGLGYFGLSRSAMPLRGPLVLSLLIGLFCLTVARAGTLESPLQGTFQYLLDGPLSMLRNVHKVDPLLRLPLAMGIGHVAARLLASTRQERRSRILSLVAFAVMAALVVAAAQPLFVGRLRKPGWDQVPQAWSQAADYLGKRAEGRATLILPGSGFGQQFWGWTIDEPIQGLAKSPWVTRSQIPLTPGATIRFLDSIEERDDDGVGSPQLGAQLARAGIGYVLVRRDLDIYASGTPAPARVDLSIKRSGGLERVASFGRSGFGGQSLIDVYKVSGEVPRVEAVDVSGVRTLYGGPEDVLTALESGVLPVDAPVVIVGQKGWDDVEPDIVGDGYRLRERQFGRSHDAVGEIMAKAEKYRAVRAAHDYPGAPGIKRVYAKYEGIASLSASSSAGYADTLGASRPERGPYAAFDGLASTFWQSAPLLDPTDQWIQADFDKPRPLMSVKLLLGVDGVSGLPIRRVTVTAGKQTGSYPVDPTSGEVDVPLRGAPVKSVRVSVTRTAGDAGLVAVREISFPGLRVARTLVVPDGKAGARTSFVMRARPHRSACIDTAFGPTCRAEGDRTSEEERGLSRELKVDQPGTWQLSGKVVALPDVGTQRLLEPVQGGVRVRATSVFRDEAAVSGQLAFDGNQYSYWMADPAAPNPALVLRWSKKRTLTRLQVTPPGGGAVEPSRAVLRSGKQVRTIDLGPDAFGTFAPIRTRHVRITFPRSERLGSTPIGVSELHLDGLDDLQYKLDRASLTGAICGLGPEVRVDGKVYRTTVTGTIDQVLSGGPLTLTGCSGPVRMGAGEHDVRLDSTSQFGATSLNLISTSSAKAQPGSAAGARRNVTIREWTTYRRVVDVAGGPAALLRVPENVNDGWVARLDGKQLERVTIDGWQQGYRLPAGSVGRVVLTFAPDRLYRLGLLVGALFGLLVLGVSLVAWRRGGRPGAPLLNLVPERRPWRGRWQLPALVLAFVLGGIAVVAGYLLALAGRRWMGEPARLAGPLIALAGVISGVLALGSTNLPPVYADVLAGAGVGLFAAAVATSPLRHKGPDEPSR